MSSPPGAGASGSTNPYLALGLVPPKRSFLDARKPSGEAPASVGPRNADAVILGEHKVELTDMLQESIAVLKNVYRSKFVFGEHLKFVDPSFSGDTVNRFNLTSPPSFDPAYAHQLQADAPGSTSGGAGGAAPSSGGGVDADGGGAVKEKLRTAEELIKKLYRRNNQLEVENKYFKAEIQRFERLAGLGRSPAHTLTVFDGHLPTDHPLYTKRQKRNCRSCPPTRTLLRTCVDGFGLTFPQRGAADDDEGPVVKEDPPAVATLKKRVVNLTEAIVTIQHENEKLTQEKIDRVTLRDNLLKRYLVERDSHIAQLHTALQEVLSKVQNPMKLTRTRQPSSSMSPVVAANNVLKEISQRLTDSIAATADEIVKKATQAIPPDTAAAAAANAGSPDAAAAGDKNSVGIRRKELANRLRQIADSMPVTKRKQLLLLFMELKQLYECLVNSNKSLLQTYEEHMRRADHDMIGLKIQVTSLRDQLRAIGVAEEEVDTHASLRSGGGGASGTSRANPPVPPPSGRADP